MLLRSLRDRVTFALIFVVRTLRNFVLSTVFLIGFIAIRLVRPSSGPSWLRWYFQTCGGAFVKAGQILAMRYDLLPEPYCRELAKLLDQLPPVRLDAILSVIETDLGRKVDECYLDFNPVALASASIAQVHEAKLLDGTAVVVKVMRPGIQRDFRIDLSYISIVGWLVDTFGPLGIMGARRIIRELIQLTREELDFHREARNLELMHDRMEQDDIDHYAPRLYPTLSGRMIITMEKITGVTVAEIIEAVESGNQEKLDEWSELGIRPRRTARLLMRSVLEQSMRHRLFHADPHAANLIVMKGGTLAWVDFGMLGSLDERLWLHQFKLREAISQNKIHAAYHNLVAAFEPMPLVDLTNFEAEVKDYIRDWISSSESSVSTLGEKSSGFFFIRIFDAVRRAKLSLPVGLMRLYRTIIIADIAMLRLDPKIDWLPVIKEFVSDEQRRRIIALVGECFNTTTISTALLTYVSLPKTGLTISDWVQNQLPEVGRVYRQQMTRFERLMALFFSYSRITVGFLVLFVLIGRFVAPRFFSSSGWFQLTESLQSYWLVMVGAGILLMLLLQRLAHEFQRPTPR